MYILYMLYYIIHLFICIIYESCIYTTGNRNLNGGTFNIELHLKKWCTAASNGCLHKLNHFLVYYSVPTCIGIVIASFLPLFGKLLSRSNHNSLKYQKMTTGLTLRKGWQWKFSSYGIKAHKKWMGECHIYLLKLKKWRW